MLRSSDSDYRSYVERGTDFAQIIEEIIFLVVFTALGALIRFWKLGDWSFWADEIFSVQDALKFPDTININPIMYFIVHNIINFFGISEWSARLGPCIIGIMGIPIIYLFARSLFGVRVALISALLLVVHPWHIFWSQNARAYSLAFLLSAISALLFFQAFEKNKVIYTLGSLLFTVLAISSYLHCVLLLPVFVGYLILISFLPVNMPKGFNAKNIVVFFLPFVLSALLFIVPSVREYILSGWGVNEWGRNTIYIFFTLIYSLSIPLSTASLIGGLHSFVYLNRGGIFLICYAIIPLLIILAISPLLNVAGYYLFFTMPAYIILAGLVASELIEIGSKESKAISSAVMVILTITLISQTYLYFMNENGGREKWKEAFKTISGKVEKDDYVVISMPRIAEYYLQNAKTLQLENIMGSIDSYKNNWRSEQKNVWFILDESSLRVLDPRHEFKNWVYA
ncbi:MAG: glycosyltransferase family 39 protein, partial [Candidatus Poribacteria bacterium]